MNCLEFRRRLGVDPLSTAADLAQHRQQCPRCAEAAARAAEFEVALRRALNVESPPHLAESILLAQATRQRRRVGLVRRGGLLALAALLVAALGLGLRADARPLPEQAVDHLRHEADALTSTTPLPDQAIRDAFAKRGLSLARVPSGIAYVACCPMGRHATVHMVMPEGDGPVTVIYVVDQGGGGHDEFQRDGLRGRSVALGRGTLILLARSADHFDAVEAAWREALKS
jgi:hypothetical protein